MLLLLLLAEGRLRRGPEPARPVPGLLQGGLRPDRLARVSGGYAGGGGLYMHTRSASVRGRCSAPPEGVGVLRGARGVALVTIPPGGGVVSSHREVELSRPTGRWSCRGSYRNPAERSSRRPSPRGAGGRAVCRPGGVVPTRARICTTTLLSGAHGGRARGGQAAGRYVSLGRWARGAPRFGRPGGVVLARARTCTTTRLSGAHGGRARGGQTAGRYVGSPGGQSYLCHVRRASGARLSQCRAGPARQVGADRFRRPTGKRARRAS